MSVTTKGIISGNFESKVFEVIAKVSNALEKTKTVNMLGHEIPSSAAAEFLISNPIKVVRCIFKDGDSKRMLHIHFDCHSDNEDLIAGDKLIFSLGAFGNAVTIIDNILEEFEERRILIPADN